MRRCHEGFLVLADTSQGHGVPHILAIIVRFILSPAARLRDQEPLPPQIVGDFTVYNGPGIGDEVIRALGA